MKRYFWVVLLAVMLCAISTPGKAQDSSFSSQEQTIEEIQNYYKEVLGKLSIKIYLLDIVSSEEDSNILCVYFMVETDPKFRKDMYDNINSSKEPVMVAIYNYSYFKYNWRLKTIRSAPGGLVFKVD